MTSISEPINMSLELFDLIQVVDECLGHLLNKEWSIGNLELNITLDVVVLPLNFGHLLLADLFAHFSLQLPKYLNFQ